MRHSVRILALLLVVAAVCAPIDGAVLVVAPLGGDFAEIQPAIDAAAAGDEVLVTPGEYVITAPITFRGKAITVRGEAGAEETVIRMAENPAVASRASVVIFESGETEASVLEGVTLTGGRGTFKDLVSIVGGGVYCQGSSPALRSCTIAGNSTSKGGGVYCSDASPALTQCTIRGNSASYMLTGGGGVYAEGASSPALTRCRILGNSASNGGGVNCDTGSSPILTDCIICGNTTWNYGGGGVYCRESSPTLTRCSITMNSSAKKNDASTGSGGGIYCTWESSPTLRDCTISENCAAGGGGGVACHYSFTSLTNCTISGNSSGVAGDPREMTLTSCIVWGNAEYSLWDPALSNERIIVTFSCIEAEERWPGEGNINIDPLFCGFAGPRDVFVDPESPSGGDGSAERPLRELGPALEYRLSLLAPGSPCIGAGKDGVNMGADTGTCDSAGSSERMVHLAAGRYGMEGLTLAWGQSIRGEGEEETVLEGTVWGLRTGSTLSQVTVTAGRHGGIVVPPGEGPAIEDCTITGNSTVGHGAGVRCGTGSSLTLTRCTISGNSTKEDGGGVYCPKGSSLTLTDCVISRNLGNNGGGVHCAGTLTMTRCTISENSASRGGGGAFCGGLTTLTDCTVSRNHGDYGGGVYCYGSSTLSRSAISGNHGGGVYGSSGSHALRNCRVSENAGIGVRGGSFALADCMISGNRDAGVHFSSGPLIGPSTMFNCTISGNSDGGVYCGSDFPATLSMTNCTVSGNSSEYRGAGVGCYANSVLTITNCLVWGNTPESVCGELSHCLTDCDPLFVHYGDFDFTRTVTVVIGGKTYSLPDFIVVPPDYRLQIGSPAIDAGTCVGAPATDIEGGVRPQGAGCDIGAYEYAAPLVVAFTRGDGNGDALLNIADAVFVLQYLFAGGGEPECRDALDADDDGKLDIADAIAVLQHLFARGGPLAAPFEACGSDSTADELDCGSYPPCE